VSAEPAAGILLLGDIGSTFIKLVAINPGGRLLARYKLPTTHEDLAAGIIEGERMLSSTAALTRPPSARFLSSSAGGGLRVIVLGYERELTVKAALRTSATAGARIVGIYTPGELDEETAAGLDARCPDLVLLTGGTDGGDEFSIVRCARRLRALSPDLPVVVAGNQSAYAAVRGVLGNGRPISFVGNVMPRIGEVNPSEAQRAIREIFIAHVMGHGRYASASTIAESVRLPTPAAVLAGAEAIAAEGANAPLLARPVLVDVGGATTDVHSVLLGGQTTRGYATSGLADRAVTRTVEGDLGLRENAETLVAVAIREGYATADEAGELTRAAAHRAAERQFVPDTATEVQIEERLTELATAIALHRHAGVMRTSLTPGGAILRRTGRDLRDATCLVVTGGVFEHTANPARITRRALAGACEHGALIDEELPIFRDREYLLWSAGLLRDMGLRGAREIVRATLESAEDQ
jgi:uncharacterized protein (TIGR01319 family)